jgi:hypothetical protein
MIRYHGTARHWNHTIPIVLTAGIGLLILLLVNFVPALGHHIPEEDVGTDYRLAFLWAFALWLSLLVWPIPNADKHALLWIWPAKIMVVLGAFLFFESHYEIHDSFGYYATPKQDGFRWPGFEFGQGGWNIISLSWLHQQVIPGDSYHTMKVSFAMVGLIAIYLFYRAAVRFLGREDIRVLYLLALFPSILFWSSNIGKEPVVLLGIGLYVYGTVGIYPLRSPDLKWLTYAASIAAGVTLASLIRVWLGPILLAPLAVFILFTLQSILTRGLVVMVVAVAFVHTISLANDSFKIETREDLVERTHNISHAAAKGVPESGGSSLSVPRFQDLSSMVRFVPLGVFTALFRPLPGEVLNPFGLLASLENVGLLLLLLRAIKRSKWKDLSHPLVLWAITLILLWSIVYGFNSIQNLGAAVRWRLQVLPLLVGLLCYLGRCRSGEAASALVCSVKQMRTIQA